jgi:hypothetical protein
MNDLLNLAMKAHGGLERWKQVRNMQAKVTLNGTLWRIKGWPDGLSGPSLRSRSPERRGTLLPAAFGLRTPTELSSANRKIPETHSPVPSSRRSGTNLRNSTSQATRSGITSRPRSCWLSPALRSKKERPTTRMVRPGDSSA